MKKNAPEKTLYPQKQNVTIKNFILEDRQLLVLIILVILIIFLLISCIIVADFFRAENFYNYI